jgi:hypothetical protein
MESVMYDQVIKFLSDHHLIPTEQHEFLPGKSVQSNLMWCMSEWTRSLDSERPFDVVYLDFSKVFDKVPKCRILRKLSNLGNVLRWIDWFLSDRTFRVGIGGALSRSVDVLNRVPQRSVLGPLLFIAYTADIRYFNIALCGEDDIVRNTPLDSLYLVEVVAVSVTSMLYNFNVTVLVIYFPLSPL